MIKKVAKVPKTMAKDLSTADRAFRIESMITIVDKQGNKIPFLLWPHQRKVLKHMGPGIVVVIKGRQMGLTTLNLADKLCKARLFENRECLIINKDLEDSKVMFAKVRELDADLGPDFQGEKKTDTGMMLHYGDNNCMMRITTAGQTESVTERKGLPSGCAL